MPPQRQFVAITTPVPEFLPMTPAQQDAYGRRLGIPQRLWRHIVKRPVLCLPHTPRCQSWARWAADNNGLPIGAGFAMMNIAQYNLQAMGSETPHMAEDQESSVCRSGKPLVFYQWVVAALDESPENDAPDHHPRATVSPSELTNQ